jgi:hypothetical protein
MRCVSDFVPLAFEHNFVDEIITKRRNRPGCVRVGCSEWFDEIDPLCTLKP